MATNIKSPMLTVGIETVTISGSFVNPGAALTSVKGKGFTATRTSAGLITVVLNQKYNALIAGRADIQPVTPPSKFEAQVSAALTTNDTFTITQYDGSSGAPAAADAGATDRTSFTVLLSTSSVNA